MRIISMLARGMAAASLLAVNLPGTTAEAKGKSHYRRYVHQYRFPSPHWNGLRRSIDGDLVDRDGWRFRNGQWDNSCFNLLYLPSQFACSTNGGDVN